MEPNIIISNIRYFIHTICVHSGYLLYLPSWSFSASHLSSPAALVASQHFAFHAYYFWCRGCICNSDPSIPTHSWLLRTSCNSCVSTCEIFGCKCVCPGQTITSNASEACWICILIVFTTSTACGCIPIVADIVPISAFSTTRLLGFTYICMSI